MAKKKEKAIGKLDPEDEKRLDNELDRAPFGEVHELLDEGDDPYSEGFADRVKAEIEKDEPTEE